MTQVTISEAECNQRLDKYLMKLMNTAPKSFIYKMLRKKRIKINNKKATGQEILKAGDMLTFYISDETRQSFTDKAELSERSAPTFDVLYEDDNILAVCKPAGVLSHPGKADDDDALSRQILFYLWGNGDYQQDSGFTPAICNRLDRNTSGIVLAGKNMKALQSLNDMMKDGSVEKYYLTLVKGVVRPSDAFQTLTGFIKKDAAMNQVEISDKETSGSKPIVTRYRSLYCGERYSLLEVLLEAGKPHQIRAHLAHHGLFIVGDKKYGERGTNLTFIRKFKLNAQFLHAHALVFKPQLEYPALSYLSDKKITCPLPDQLQRILDEMPDFKG